MGPLSAPEQKKIQGLSVLPMGKEEGISGVLLYQVCVGADAGENTEGHTGQKERARYSLGLLVAQPWGEG